MRIRFFALAALALSLAACTQDEAGFLPEGAEGTPIVFTATGLNPTATATAGTRAPVDEMCIRDRSLPVRSMFFSRVMLMSVLPPVSYTHLLLVSKHAGYVLFLHPRSSM